MENGRDKTWGGANYKLAGVIAAAVPNAANTLAAIQKWVYNEKTFQLSDVLDAFRSGYYDKESTEEKVTEKQLLYDKIKDKFQNHSPKFGNKEAALDNIMEWLLNTFYDTVKESQALAEEIFLNPVKEGEEKRITSLRALAGYAGKSLKEEFGKDFNINITAGMGTFELFDIFGGGNAASADRENIGDPIARNFAPQAGSTTYSIGHLLSSFKNLGLDRFAGGVITDLCLEEGDLKANGKDMIGSIIEYFMKNNGNMMSITISDREMLQYIYTLCEKYRNGDESVKKELKQYERVNVRVGGFQMPFITLPEEMQKTYIERPISATI
jgi:formate C-acetyltransferase